MSSDDFCCVENGSHNKGQVVLEKVEQKRAQTCRRHSGHISVTRRGKGEKLQRQVWDFRNTFVRNRTVYDLVQVSVVHDVILHSIMSKKGEFELVSCLQQKKRFVE